MRFFLSNLWESPESKGTLDLADVVLQDGLLRETLSQMEAVLNLEGLADGSLLGARAHCARRYALGVTNIYGSAAHVTL